MGRGRYHIISRGGKWALKREGAVKPQKIFATKSEAMKASKKYLKEKFDVVIHNTTGAVSQWKKGNEKLK